VPLLVHSPGAFITQRELAVVRRSIHHREKYHVPFVTLKLGSISTEQPMFRKHDRIQPSAKHFFDQERLFVTQKGYDAKTCRFVEFVNGICGIRNASRYKGRDFHCLCRISLALPKPKNAVRNYRRPDRGRTRLS